ncbi:MAG: hypothetical protein GY856_44685 [bacterium]|nr:hypothetical protein [bacterium]
MRRRVRHRTSGERAKRLALARGEEERLELRWKPGFDELTLLLDGELLGTVPTKRELRVGRSFRLPDGTSLRIRLTKDFFGFSLELERDGRPLPDSPGALGPPHRLAYRILYFLAGFNLGGGLFLSVTSAEQLGRVRPGWVLLTGLLYLVLGVLVHRRSAPALVLAIAVYAGDGIRSAIAALPADDDVSVVGLLVRGVLVAGMIRGIRATRLLPPRNALASPGMKAILGESSAQR